MGHVDAHVEGGPGGDDGQPAQVVVHSVPEGADVAGGAGAHKADDHLRAAGAVGRVAVGGGILCMGVQSAGHEV